MLPIRHMLFLLCKLVAVVISANLPAEAAEPSGRELLVATVRADIKSGTTVVGQVKQGERFPLGEVNGEWYRINFRRDGKALTGWIHQKSIRIAQAETDSAGDSPPRKAAGNAGPPEVAVQTTSVEKKSDADQKRLAEAKALTDQATSLYREGKKSEAVPLTRQALAIYSEELGPADSSTLTWMNSLARLLRELGDYPAARKQYEELLAICRKARGDQHLQTAETLQNLGLTLKYSGDHAAARTHYEEALTIHRKLLGEQHLKTAGTLNHLAALTYQIRDYTAARKYLEDLLVIRKKTQGEQHLQTADTLSHLGETLVSLNERAAARPHFEQALEIRKKLLGEEHLLTADSMNSLGLLLKQSGNLAAARPYYEQALAVRRKLRGERHGETVTSLNNLGMLLLALKDYDNARKHLNQALAICREVVGEEHSFTAMALHNLGELQQTTGNVASARTHYEQSLAVRKKVLGESHPLTLQTTRTLGDLLWKAIEYDDAQSYYEQTIRILRATRGTQHAETAVALDSLGMLLKDSGDYESAQPCLEEALAIRMNVLGEQHLDTAVSLNNRGLLLHLQGDLPAAREYYDRSLEIRRKTAGELHPHIANSYHNLGSIFWAWGNYPAALENLKRAVAIRRTSLGEQHSSTAVSINNLGILLRDMGDFSAALKLHEEALAIRRKVYGEEHSQTAQSLSNMGGTLRSMGKLAEARQYYEQAQEIQQKTVGLRHRETVRSMEGLAAVLHDMGEDAAAQEYLEQVVSIQRIVLGDHHFRTAGSLMSLGQLLRDRKDFPGAAARFEEARRILRRYGARVLPGLSQPEQLAFLKQTDEAQLHGALSLGLLHPEVPGLPALSAGWLLNGKAVAHEALAQRALLARESTDPAAAAMLQELSTIRSQLARRSLKAVAPEQQEEHRQQLAELQSRADVFTRRLGQSGIDANREDPWVTLNEVRGRIPAGAVLIDIVRLQPVEFETRKQQAAHYAAWIIPAAGKGDIRVIDLGEADAADAAVRTVRKSLEQAPGKIIAMGEPQAEQLLRQPLKKLSDLVLQPLLAASGDAKQLILSPDALLWLVPWSALPISDEKYAVEDYEISFVVSGRDLVTKRKPLQSQPPLILADPDFGPAGQQPAGSQRGGSSLATLPAVQRLPGTAAEAQAIQPRIEQYAGQEPTVKTGAEATESVFRSIRRPEVLTLSTHGFFLPDQDVQRADEPFDSNGESRSAAVSNDGKLLENPLLRCGLLLAGCNTRSTAAADADDGVLTGLEIVGTDLRGTKLVVLSACETGLGVVRNGEGVAGLRQAFQLAGAESIMATLWQVPDRDTARLIVDFFEQLAQGKSRSESLRTAQLARIQSHRQRYGAAHPFFWAAVTLTGEWR